MSDKRLPLFAIMAVGLALAGCSKKDDANERKMTTTPATETSTATPAASDKSPLEQGKGYWRSATNDEGDALSYTDAATNMRVLLSCATGSNKLLVNVSSFKLSANETSLTLGSGGTTTALVADANRETVGGGVTAIGAVPTNLSTFLPAEGGLTIKYGNQNAGPLPAIPAEMATEFEEGCYD